MIYYTKYAEQKFEILNKHKVFFTKEQVEDVIKLSDKNDKINIKHFTAEKDGIKVVYRKENDMVKVVTFYPVG